MKLTQNELDVIMAACYYCAIDATVCVDRTCVVADLRRYGHGIVLLASVDDLQRLLNG